MPFRKGTYPEVRYFVHVSDLPFMWLIQYNSNSSLLILFHSWYCLFSFISSVCFIHSACSLNPFSSLYIFFQKSTTSSIEVASSTVIVSFPISRFNIFTSLLNILAVKLVPFSYLLKICTFSCILCLTVSLIMILILFILYILFKVLNALPLTFTTYCNSVKICPLHILYFSFYFLLPHGFLSPMGFFIFLVFILSEHNSVITSAVAYILHHILSSQDKFLELLNQLLGFLILSGPLIFCLSLSYSRVPCFSFLFLTPPYWFSILCLMILSLHSIIHIQNLLHHHSDHLWDPYQTS